MSEATENLRKLEAEATPRPWHVVAPRAPDDLLSVALRNAAPEIIALIEASDGIGMWLSAALDDSQACDKFKEACRAVLEAHLSLEKALR